MGLRSALSHASFRRLWLGQLASRIGDSVHEIALVWLVYEVTGSPTLLSLTFAASFVPTVVLSLPAGALVDRVNRKYVLVGGDLLRATAVLVIPVVGRGPWLVETVVAVAFFTGVVDAVDGPARTAFLPRLVPEENLDAANSLVATTRSLSQVLFAAGGVVVAVFGSFSAFYVDAGTFVVSALLVATIPAHYGVPDRDDTEREAGADATSGVTGVVRAGVDRTVRDVREVLGFVSGRRVLVNLLVLSAALQFAVAPVNVAAPVFAPTLPLPGGFALGLLYSAFFTGMTAGTMGIGRFDGAVDARRGAVIVGGMVGFGSALALAVSVPASSLLHAVPVLALFLAAGLAFAAATVPGKTLAQLRVPDERLGRWGAVSGTFSSLAFVVGLTITGPIIGVVGARATLFGVGALFVALAAVFAFQPLARVHRADADGDASRATGRPADG